MLSYSFYNWIHMTFLFTTFASLGAICIYRAQGGDKPGFTFRRLLAIVHGIATVLVFVAGFGLMARTGFSFGNSPWLYIKILAWLVVATFPFFVWRVPARKGTLLFFVLVGTGLIGAWAATFKPFVN